MGKRRARACARHRERAVLPPAVGPQALIEREASHIRESGGRAHRESDLALRTFVGFPGILIRATAILAPASCASYSDV